MFPGSNKWPTYLLVPTLQMQRLNFFLLILKVTSEEIKLKFRESEKYELKKRDKSHLVFNEPCLNIYTSFIEDQGELSIDYFYIRFFYRS